MRDVAAVHSTLWPEDHNERGILSIGVLTGAIPVYDAETGEIVNDEHEEEKSKERSLIDACNAAEVGRWNSKAGRASSLVHDES